ncbi:MULTISPECIES: YcxB family protein [unclassified Exiguobacterium]|nr:MULTISPECIES: YcxB family protein [unclassified Exiguobacterium]TCI24836.1 YcxB family protein [Exiguobacterium sp. SH5S4]TCI49931.1 YcxB family protein [Exiguobacterium sp. SH5S13]TCI59070.1 YcxB family protein [Exiguobacterium sp. SH0S2]
MIVKYQMSYEDYMALQKDSLKRTKFHRIKSSILFILLTVMVFLFGIVLSILVLPQSSYLMSFKLYQLLPIFIGILLALVMMCYVKKFYAFATIAKLRFMLRNDKRWPHDITLNIHEVGIDLTYSRENSDTTTKVIWDSVKTIGQDRNHLFLYYEETEAVIIPTSYNLLGKEKQEILRKLLKQHLNYEFQNNSD